MKSKEPQEPQDGPSPDVAEWYYRIPFYLKEYGSYLLLGVALVVLGFQVYNYYQTKKEVALQEAWAKLDAADRPTTMDPPSQLNDVIATVEAKNIQAMAYLKLGLFYLKVLEAGTTPGGVQGVKVTPDEAETEAGNAFNHVISDYADQPLPVAIAHMGLGNLAEARGDWDAAREQYQTVVKAAPDSATGAYITQAQYRLDHLDDWKRPLVLAKVEPVATAPATAPMAPMSVPPLDLEPGPSLAPLK